MAAIRFADTVRAHTREALVKGALPLIDAGRFPADRAGTAYLMPQVLVDVDHTMQVMMEESFGPVVGIMKVSSDEAAVRTDERQSLRVDRFGLDSRCRRGRADWRWHRHRHGLHEPLRLCRSFARLDR